MDFSKTSGTKTRKMPVSITVNVTKKFEAALNEYVEHISKEKKKSVNNESVIISVVEDFLEKFKWKQENCEGSSAWMLDLPHIPDDAL
jgi:hypothetical protein